MAKTSTNLIALFITIEMWSSRTIAKFCKAKGIAQKVIINFPIRNWLPHKIFVQDFWKEFVKYRNSKDEPNLETTIHCFIDAYEFLKYDHVNLSK